MLVNLFFLMGGTVTLHWKNKQTVVFYSAPLSELCQGKFLISEHNGIFGATSNPLGLNARGL